jgi:hypothetical protein
MPIPLGILAVAGAGGAAAGAYDLLETVAPTADFTFTGLDSYSQYKHLQIRMMLRSTSAGDAIADMGIRFNNDTGANYFSHRLYGSGSTVTSSFGISTTQLELSGVVVRTSATANAFTASVIDILDFNNASKNTTVRGLSGLSVSTDNSIRLFSGAWNNTAAVTSINIRGSGGLATGCRVSLYGVK